MKKFNSRYDSFIFESFSFDKSSHTLTCEYSFDGERKFVERVVFDGAMESYNEEIIERLGFYYFIAAGTSYYKTFLAPNFVIKQGALTEAQAGFFNQLYKGGLSQYLYENEISYENLAKFEASESPNSSLTEYSGEGILLMESGGKDSILSAELLKKAGHDFVSWHMSSTGNYPKAIFDLIGGEKLLAKREIDVNALQQAKQEGAFNGHVPFSAIYAGTALIHAVLSGKRYVFASNESSADEANVVIDGYKINHQYSKTYEFELMLQNYIHSNITEGLDYGSLLRPLSEVKVSELFAMNAWEKYRNSYSSCNLANYKQGEDGGRLTWDGKCPKCANTFLLFAQFVKKEELLELFGGKNLMKDPELKETFLQLLDLSKIKPFECVGTFDEMKYSYAKAKAKDNDFSIDGVEVDGADFDHNKLHSYQEMFDKFLDYKSL